MSYWGQAVSVVDADGDGDLDLFVGNRGANQLLINDGAGVFEISDRFLGEPLDTTSTAWADYDGDGDLDLYVANFWWPSRDPSIPEEDGDPNKVWANAGDGSFVDMSSQLSRGARDGLTNAGGWVDVDVDGDQDLYVINDKAHAGWQTTLMENIGGTLYDDEGARYLNIGICGMGLGIGDVNRDGLPDFAITGWYELALMLSLPDGTWYDAAISLGLLPDEQRIVGWGADIADLDSDGLEDVIVTFGGDLNDYGQLSQHPKSGVQNTRAQRFGLYLQGEDGQLTESSASLGFEESANHRGFVLVDLNRDGYLDIVERDIGGCAEVHLARCGADSWLGVSLRSPGPNTFAVGARVEARAGDQTWWRVVTAGSTNIASGNPPEVLFGFGDVETLDELTIRWPDGRQSTLRGVDTRQHLEISRINALR